MDQRYSRLERPDAVDYFKPGDHVVVRDIDRGKSRAVVPSIVVEDGPEPTVTFIPVGAELLILTGDWESHSSQQVRAISDLNGQYRRHSWRGRGSLRISQRCNPWSMGVFWNHPGGELSSWYVNLERPQVRTDYGFSLHDELLDVVIAPDRKSWKWKDEDELAEAIGIGFFTPGDEARLRANGLAAVERIQSGEPPFDASWADFKRSPRLGHPTSVANRCRASIDQGLVSGQTQFTDQTITCISHKEVTIGVEDHTVWSLKHAGNQIALIVEVKIEDLNAVAPKL